MLEQIAKERVFLRKFREKYIKTSQPGVSIIAPTNKLKYMNNLFSNYTRFKYPHRELIIILNNNKLNINNYKLKANGLKDIQIFQLDQKCTLGECLNFGIKHSKYNYISKMDDDDYYGANYLIDLMNVFKYTDAKVTGKSTRFVYFEDSNILGIYSPNYENGYVSGNIAGGTLTFKKEILEKVKFRYLNGAGTDKYFLEDCNSTKIKMFSSDKYNYVYIKHKNSDDHTWKITSERLMKYNMKKLLVTSNFTYLASV